MKGLAPSRSQTGYLVHRMFGGGDGYTFWKVMDKKENIKKATKHYNGVSPVLGVLGGPTTFVLPATCLVDLFCSCLSSLIRCVWTYGQFVQDLDEHPPKHERDDATPEELNESYWDEFKAQVANGQHECSMFCIRE